MLITPYRNNRDAVDSRKSPEGRFDLEQFDPVTTDLDAVLLTTKIFEQTIDVDPPPAACPQHASSVAVKARGEARGGEARTPPIPVRQITAPDHDFADFAARDRLTIVADKQDVHVSCKTSDRKQSSWYMIAGRPARPSEVGSFRGRKRMNQCARPWKIRFRLLKLPT